MQGVDERAWIETTLPNTDNLRAAFEHAFAERDVDLALRLVAALPELTHVRGMYEADEWAERSLDLADRSHPLFAAAVGTAARGAWGSATSPARTRSPPGRRAPPRRGHRTVGTSRRRRRRRRALPGRRGRRGGALHGRGRPRPPRGRPIRLVWTLYYVAICRAVRRAPEDGVPAAEEALAVARETGNPTALSMGHYALGLVLKKSHPEQALALLDEAARLAAEVQNFWWEGIALMEAAATRAVHGDPAEGAAALVTCSTTGTASATGPSSGSTCATSCGCSSASAPTEDAAVLHHSLVAAGKPSPLKTAGPGRRSRPPRPSRWPGRACRATACRSTRNRQLKRSRRGGPPHPTIFAVTSCSRSRQRYS